jgi:DNA-binding NarL/FixJ family response regulator
MVEASPDAASTDAPLRLLIVDDQPLIRRGLALMLASEAGIEVVGQAADGLEAIALATALLPDVVVMDLQMPRASGVVATREITRQLSATRVVVLTTYDDDERVFEAIRAGAHAYLLKDATEQEVLDTVRAVHRGESRLSPTIARKVMEQFRAISLKAGYRRPPPPNRPPIPPILPTPSAPSRASRSPTVKRASWSLWPRA